MYDKLHKYLDEKKVFSGLMAPAIVDRQSAVTGTVSHKLKLSIAVSEVVLFASQFRRYVILPNDNDTKIPINSISISLAGSGESKDRAVKAIRSTLKKGYNSIKSKRKVLATEDAVRRAIHDGHDKEEAEKWEIHKEYYKAPAELFTAMTNPAAYLDHLAHTESLQVGAGFIYSGEIGSEMGTNADLIPTIRLMSELYDVGYKEAKPLKSKDSQTPEIVNLPVSALFVGAHENILYDENIKNMFRIETATKLGRRFHFTFSPEELKEPEYENIEDMFEIEAREEARVGELVKKLSTESTKIADENLNRLAGKHIRFAEDAYVIYKAYQRYCTEAAKRIDKRFPLSIVSCKHRHWRALKLAGALVVFDCGTEITSKNLIHAISYVEYIAPDLEKFETELVKETYENFSDYMKLQGEKTGKHKISLHALKKLQYIPAGKSHKTAMESLRDLASSYDPNGIYSIENNHMVYEKIEKTEVTGASFLEVDNSRIMAAIERGASKEEISNEKMKVAAQTVSGYEFAESVFPELANLLALDLAFTPFKLKDGVRGKDNIISGTTWICFDVDNTPLTDEECHYMLGDINHHIARTSDENNDKKYRVIVQLDAYVKVERKVWDYFIKSISNFLCIPIDKLPQSQIFFGYDGREVLSVTDKSPIEVKNHLTYAHSQAEEHTPDKQLTPKEKSAQLAAPMATFEWAFNAKDGEGSRSLYGAAWKAFHLGASKDEIKKLLMEISDYWIAHFLSTGCKACSDK